MSPLLTFTLGLLSGALLGWLLRGVFRLLLNLPAWSIGETCLRENGQVQIEVGVPTSTPAVQFLRFHSQVLTADPGTVEAPGSGSTQHGNSSPLLSPGNGMTSTTSDCVVVWAEFRVYEGKKMVGLIPACPSGGSGTPSGMRMRERVVPAGRAWEFEAIPRAYRVAPAAPPTGAAGGPAADVVGSLGGDRGGLLEHSLGDSTPTEPIWRAGGGPGGGVRWTLCLLHRRDGMGAVLTAVYTAGDGEVRLTWVTSDWRFHAANRLTPEADEPGTPALLVRPA